MNDLLPEKFVKREELNLWMYDKILDKYLLVKNYLSEKFKSWVKNVTNPFEIPWIMSLYKGKLDFLEENLKNLERKMTSSNIKQFLEELPIKSKEPVEFVRKIKSIAGEMNIYGYLKGEKGFETVEKISQNGDLKCDDKVIVSVKRKESISAPYEYVENIIKALAYVEENGIIRKYNKISLNKLDKLGYRHLNLIYKYLRNYLVKDLIESDKKIMNGVRWNETKPCSIDEKHTLKLEISVDPEGSYPIQLMFFVNKSQNVEIKFHNHSSYSNYFTLFTDKDSYFNSNKFEVEVKEYLKEYVEDKIDEVCRKEKKPDILWIDILLHPRYEEPIKQESEQTYFRNIINSKKYAEFETILSFTSKFGAESVILETSRT